ncbi:MAG: hypothetical protein Q9M11_08725 [Mariprofundaceae bacterium]|nr:hypothetical protein [Mariprofundaceae bacterium]
MLNKMNQHVPEMFKQLYGAVSIAFFIPIVCWPLALHVGLEPAWGTSIEKNWLIAASLLLMTFTICDTFLAKPRGFYDVSVSIVWVLFSAYMVMISFHNLSLAWFLAATMGLRALWISPNLWDDSHVQWWQWQAWFRDSSAAFAMFVWLIYW